MTILHILSSDDKYGSALCFKDLLESEIKRSDITPVVITPKKNRINELCNQLNVQNYTISYEQFQIPKHNTVLVFMFKYIWHLMRYYLGNGIASNRIKRIVSDNKVDLIHTNSSVVDIGAVVSEKTGVPHVWHLREFGKEDFNFYSTRINSIDYMNRTTSGFIAVSKSVKNAWIIRGLNESKIHVFYDGVKASSFKEHCTKSTSEITRIAMTGSYSKTKGQIVLVKALSLIKDRINVRVSLFGNPVGDYYNEVKKAIEDYGLTDVVTIEGYTTKINRILNEYDIGVICSKSEAFGRVTVEYMLSGLCPVAPRSGANVELLEENDCGVLYEPNDSKSLADSLLMLANSPETINSYGEKARSIALREYDIEKNSISIIDYLKTNSRYDIANKQQ